MFTIGFYVKKNLSDQRLRIQSLFRAYDFGVQFFFNFFPHQRRHNDVMVIITIKETDLEVFAGHTACQLLEEANLHFGELGRLDDVDDLFQLVQEHHLSKPQREISQKSKWTKSTHVERLMLNYTTSFLHDVVC